MKKNLRDFPENRHKLRYAMTPENHTERGQALVLIALSIVVLLGFSALAIDGGMVYADRRHAQNAADASALAAGGMAALAMDNGQTYYDEFSCDTSLDYVAIKAIDTAKARAASNDYIIDNEVESDHHGVVVHCGADNSSGGYVDRYLDIEVDITRTTDTSLVHFVYSGPVQNEVQAIARLRPRTSLGFGQAIIALNEAACSGNQYGLIFSGSTQSQILGGGIFTNGCLYGNGSQFSVEVNDGDISYVKEKDGTLANISPQPVGASKPLPDWVIGFEAPDCEDPSLTNFGNHAGPGTISQGVYSTISLHNGTLTLSPGLYCLTGGPSAFTANGGEIFGEGVTISVLSGGVSINGNVDVELSAPMSEPVLPSLAINGLLFYMAEGNTSEIGLIGNSDSTYMGTIFAPDGDIYISGSVGTIPTFRTQIIGYNVEISGDALINFRFDRARNITISPMVDLQK
jgi:hypothetical protein